MAFSVTPNPRSGEMPAAEHPPQFAPEQPGDLRVEQESIPEAKPVEVRTDQDVAAAQELRATMNAPAPSPVVSAPADKTDLERKIDAILEADLKDIYRDLPELVRPEFKKRGEEAASKIKKLIESAKVTGSKIAAILRKWLRVIPETGKFFVEQIVKIKTDQLVELSRLAMKMM